MSVRSTLSLVMTLAITESLVGCSVSPPLNSPPIAGNLAEITVAVPIPTKPERLFLACTAQPWNQSLWDTSRACAADPLAAIATAQDGITCSEDGVTPFSRAAKLLVMQGTQDSAEAQFKRLLEHPVLNKLTCSYVKLQRKPADTVPAEITLSVKDIREFVQLVHTLTQTGGWSVARAKAKAATDEGAQKRERYAAYIEAYFEAYFQNGQFTTVNFSLADLYTRYPGLAPYKDVLEKDLQPLLTKETIGKVGDSQFTSRSGRQLQFPAISVTVDPTAHSVIALSKIDYTDVGADMVRVVVEALWDAHDPLPAVAGATGVTSSKLTKAQQLPLLATDGHGAITAAQIQQSSTWANAVDGAAASGAGQLLRMGGPFGLNNEAVAKAVEAMIGVIARKWTEKAAFCYYACRPATADSPTSTGTLGQNLDEPATAKVTVKIVP